jgi:hypothetical protein
MTYSVLTAAVLASVWTASTDRFPDGTVPGLHDASRQRPAEGDPAPLGMACLSKMRQDSLSAQCQSFCHMDSHSGRVRYTNPHCEFCKCAACAFCPAGDETDLALLLLQNSTLPQRGVLERLFLSLEELVTAQTRSEAAVAQLRRDLDGTSIIATIGFFLALCSVVLVWSHHGWLCGRGANVMERLQNPSRDGPFFRMLGEL